MEVTSALKTHVYNSFSVLKQTVIREQMFLCFFFVFMVLVSLSSFTLSFYLFFFIFILSFFLSLFRSISFGSFALSLSLRPQLLVAGFEHPAHTASAFGPL